MNRLWAECPHLGSGLVQELETKHLIVRKLAKEGKRGRTRFISAEGCYSWVVASTPGMRLKFSAKAFADWSDHREFYVIDGAVRKCRFPSQIWGDPYAQAGLNSTCNPFGPRVTQHSVLLNGVQRQVGAPRQIEIHAECSRWVEQRYRLCADLSEEEAPSYNIMLINGTWSATRVVNQEPTGSLEGAFLHLQRWKGDYKHMSYGMPSMPKLRGRRLFKLSRFGVEVFDASYDGSVGANVTPSLKKSWIDDDDEFEARVQRLHSQPATQ